MDIFDRLFSRSEVINNVRRQSSNQELFGVTYREVAQLTTHCSEMVHLWYKQGILYKGACGALAALVSRREGAPVGAREWEGVRTTFRPRTHRLGRFQKSVVYCADKATGETQGPGQSQCRF
jgi:hypothetical protein